MDAGANGIGGIYMIGLYIEDEGLKSELEKRLKNTGCFLCNGYSPKLDLIIVQGKDKGTMDTLIMSETNVILIAECGSDPLYKSVLLFIY